MKKIKMSKQLVHKVNIEYIDTKLIVFLYVSDERDTRSTIQHRIFPEDRRQIRPMCVCLNKLRGMLWHIGITDDIPFLLNAIGMSVLKNLFNDYEWENDRNYLIEQSSLSTFIWWIYNE